MPWTMYRYVMMDMLKMMLGATFCLTIIICFVAAIIQFLGGLFSGVEALGYMMNMAPMMVQFSLPFATVFASTLLYNRMVNDNEVLALSSCGVSYHAILLPAVFLGLMLSLVMFILSNAVVPAQFGRAERMVKQDMATILVKQVQLQQGYQPPGTDWWIYADRADAGKPPEVPQGELQPQRMIVAEGLAIGKVTEGTLSHESTAGRAIILLYEEDGQSWVSIQIENTMTVGSVGKLDAKSKNNQSESHQASGVNSGFATGVSGASGVSGGGIPTGQGRIGYVEIARQPLPSVFRDQPKYKNWFELLALARNPDGIGRVAAEKKAMASTLAMTDIKIELARMDARQPMIFTAEGIQYQVIAPRRTLKGNTLLLVAEESSPVVIEQTASADNPAGQDARTMMCQKAELKLRLPELGEKTAAPRIEMTLHDVRIFSKDEELTYVHRQWPLPPLTWQSAQLTDRLDQAYLSKDVWTLMSMTREKIQWLESSQLLTEADRAKLEKKHFVMNYYVNRIIHRVLAQINLRTAHAISCCLTLLLGAMLSLRLREKMPLVVFFWSFLISVAVLITLLGGESLTKQGKNVWWIGVGVNWSGTILLGVFLMLLYRRICRN